MTTLAQGRGHGPPHPKTISTERTPRFETGKGINEGRLASRPQSRTRPSKGRPDTSNADPPSQAATLSLIRRVLAPDKSQTNNARGTAQPIDDLLPPLTTSNETDLQLYAIIAIIVKDFINVWYSKITPDHNFNEEVVQIIAHCSRALEERLRDLDLIEVLLDELAGLIDHHVEAYRYAKSQAEEYSYAASLHSIYHSFNQHPALSPVPGASEDDDSIAQQASNEGAYRQLLVQGSLAVLLPTDDIQNSSLRVLLGDILADLIIGQALAGKVCQGWFLQDAIIKSISAVRTLPGVGRSDLPVKISTKTRLEQYGLLKRKEEPKPTATSQRHRSALSVWFWNLLQFMYTMLLSIRFVIHGLHRIWTSPGRLSSPKKSEESPATAKFLPEMDVETEWSKPVVSLRAFGMMSRLIRMQDRMPWLSSMLIFLRHLALHGLGQIAAVDSVLDRFLRESLTSIFVSPTLLPQLLLSLRVALFPHNSLGPPAPPPPSKEEQIELRRKAAESIVSLIPPVVARVYFNTSNTEEIVEQIAVDVLDCFGDAYLNKHLIYGILELLLVRLLPELEEHGVSELLAERGVSLVDDQASDAAVDGNVQ